VQERAQTSVRPITLHALNKIDIRTVQADSCLNFEQIDTLLISVGGQEGGLGGGVILGQRPKLTRDCHDLGGGAPGRRVHYFFIPNRDLL